MATMNIATTCFNIFLLVVLACNVSHANAPEVLAKDDIYCYSLRDVEAYLTIESSPYYDVIQRGLSKGDSSAMSLLKETLKTLAFKQLYVHQELRKAKPPERIEFFVRETLRNYAYSLAMRELISECQITTSELELAYEKNKEKYKIGELRKISVLYKLLPENPEEKEGVVSALEELRSRQDFNENFLDYVKEQSDLPGAIQGGIVNYFTRGTYGPTVEKYAFETPEGAVSPVFSTTKGAYIIKCLEVKPAGYLAISKVAPELRGNLFSQKLDEAKKRKLNKLMRKSKIWKSASTPMSGSASLVLLKVNDFELTSGVLFSAYPDIGNNLKAEPEFLMIFLGRLAERELVLQDMEKKAKNEPHSLEGKKLGILQTVAYFRALFVKRVNKEITVQEEELRNYYKEYKTYYHGSTPKRFAYLLIRAPDKNKLPEPRFYKELEWQKRAAYKFREKVIEQPAGFVREAKKLAAERLDTICGETSWLEELPEKWNVKKSIIEFNLGSISPVLMSNDGLLIFKVIDKKAPRTLHFEEVRDKVYRVILSSKEKELYNELQEKTLEAYHFTFTF